VDSACAGSSIRVTLAGMTHRLRPGLVVVRRDPRHLQVGIDPPRRVVLPDEPEVRRTLAALVRGTPLPDDGSAGTTLAALVRAGLLAGGAPAASGAGVSVSVSAPPALAEELVALLRAAGVTVAPDGTVRVIVAHGALRRDAVDPLVRHGACHLLATVTPWGWELGPFVVPGATACLRCVDAARAERDPHRGVVLDQVAAAGPPGPADPATRALALAWLTRDLQAYGRGERPTTWSATIEVADGMPREHQWLRHPHCGCAWDALAG
jgi:hypothetical protein